MINLKYFVGVLIMLLFRRLVLVPVQKRTDTLHSFKMWPMSEWMVPNLHQTYFLIIGGTTNKPYFSGNVW
jgi:hypothetical protein